MKKVHERAKRLLWRKKEEIITKERNHSESVKKLKLNSSRLIDIKYNTTMKANI